MLLLVGLLVVNNGAAQSPLRYEVITVKPHDPADRDLSYQFAAGTLRVRNLPLDNLIAGAYGVKTWMVTGLPKWAKSASWDIDAKVADPPSRPLSKDERAELMKDLLQQRFGLAINMEQRLQPAFAMTVVQSGQRFKPAPPGPPDNDGKPTKPRSGYRSAPGVLDGALSMPSLAESLSYTMERTVVDKTGLDGLYDVKLHWTSDVSTTEGDALPALAEALQQQLGLKLTATKAQVPAAVIDAISQPDAN